MELSKNKVYFCKYSSCTWPCGHKTPHEVRRNCMRMPKVGRDDSFFNPHNGCGWCGEESNEAEQESN
jgi:hypothetical protein